MSTATAKGEEEIQQFKIALQLISGVVTIPIYLLFWICDIFYAGDFKWQFLAMRVAVALVVGILFVKAKSATTLNYLHGIGLTFALVVSLPISVMTMQLGGGTSQYYAGLNLVAIGCVIYLPWQKNYLGWVLAVIYLPYFFLNGIVYPDKSLELVLPFFFMAGTSILTIIFAIQQQRLKESEKAARSSLNLEVTNRDRIISQKTTEASALQLMSRQFSPQVVHSIQTGELDLGRKASRRKICAIFVDIENSTDRVVRLDQEELDEVISMFMDDTIRTFLKYDITVDNFLGDCVLGFSNCPFSQENFVERVILCAREIQERVKSRSQLYRRYWHEDFRLKIGIAAGHANVGFYGREEYFRRYTAIGPVMNKASRLCGHAKGGEILITEEATRFLNANLYSFANLGFVRLKGLEQDLTEIMRFEESSKSGMSSQFTPECVNGHGILFLDTDEKGRYVFKCRSCDAINEAVTA
ncbi:MAG: adenylate/guanylate cyclase domain-containing protein [Pseudomonadota bacterium]